MRGCEYGEFAACGFSCLNPLVSIQLGRIKYIIIFNGADTVIALSVADAVEYVEVIMNESGIPRKSFNDRIVFFYVKIITSRRKNYFTLIALLIKYP